MGMASSITRNSQRSSSIERSVVLSAVERERIQMITIRGLSYQGTKLVCATSGGKELIQIAFGRLHRALFLTMETFLRREGWHIGFPCACGELPVVQPFSSGDVLILGQIVYTGMVWGRSSSDEQLRRSHHRVCAVRFL